MNISSRGEQTVKGGRCIRQNGILKYIFCHIYIDREIMQVNVLLHVFLISRRATDWPTFV